MTVRVYSPNAGIPVRLKVEDAADPTHTCETEKLTTGVNTWETPIIDFTSQARDGRARPGRYLQHTPTSSTSGPTRHGRRGEDLLLR